MKKKIIAIALTSVIAASGLSALSAGASAEWVKNGSSYSYKDDETGNKLTGWQEIDGGKYYFDKTGKALTGWYKIGGSKYYFNGANKGKMVTGTVKIGGKTYSFGKDGKLKGEVKTSKTTSSSAPVKWGTSHDTIASSVKGGDIYMDLGMMIISGDETKFKMYVFDDNEKLVMFADMKQGNYLSSYKKSFEGKGYKLIAKETEDETTMYLYQKGNDIVVVAQADKDGTELTMILYFDPAFSKDLMNGGSFDTSTITDLF